MTSPTSHRRRPPGRYDDRSLIGARILAVILGALFLGLVVAIGALLYDRYGTPRVNAQTVGFSVLSDTQVRIDVQVTKEAGERAYCYVRARGEDGAEVGREAVTVDADGSDRTTIRLSHVLSTTGLAVTGEAGRCSAEPIPPPRPAP